MTDTSVPGPDDRLRGIFSVTDKALSHLDDAEFLAELLERTREVLRADVAAALLLDRSSGELILAAAAGLAGKPQPSVRIPVGAGFAGRVAARAEPVILGDEDEPAVLSPVLRY
ncbi:MAG: hypothetical protein J2P34_00820, partial [Actinobacteria bacterium]|nr:hypothetical protein [Actinomycetota bacterium]